MVLLQEGSFDSKLNPHNDASKKTVAVFGSTGSVGRQTLSVCSWFPGKFRISVLTAYNNAELLAEQALIFRPSIVVVGDAAGAAYLGKRLGGLDCEILYGREGLVTAAQYAETDIMVAAVSGVAGLESVCAAVSAGKNIALANKETLVAAGEFVMKLARENGVSVIPVDSEHSAIFQCLTQGSIGVSKLLLTASGGPFFSFSQRELELVTPEMALRHPRWEMGKKISVDSATMMNKGLEVIEARWLFDISYDKIEVLIHPQSIVHSMVRYEDGCVLAQMGIADMRIPIQYALSWPERWENTLPDLDLPLSSPLDFLQPDLGKFPCLRIACEAGRMGGLMPAAMNAANEHLVQAFLAGRIKFNEIAEYIEASLDKAVNKAACSNIADTADIGCVLENILEADRAMREITEVLIKH